MLCRALDLGQFLLILSNGKWTCHLKLEMSEVSLSLSLYRSGYLKKIKRISKV